MSGKVATAPSASPTPAQAAGRTRTAGPRCLTTITSTPDHTRISIAIRGEVDHEARYLVRDHLVQALRASRRGVDLRLDTVSFWDCSALGALLEARQHAVAEGKSLTLLTASPIVRRVLDLTGTTDLFTAPTRT